MLVDAASGNCSGGRLVTDPIADGNVAGAIYNFKFLVEDRSHGVHNFKYARDLMVHSIDYINNLP